MTKALELAKFGRESPPAGVVVGDSDTQTLSSKTFSDGPVFSSGTVNSVPFLNASKVFSTAATFVFDGTNLGVGVASPGYMLHVKGGALAATSADGTVTSTFNYNTIGTITNSVFNIVANNSTRISIAPTTTTLSGSIYIENTNAINELTFTGSEYTNLVSNSTSAFDIGTNVAGPLLLTTNSIERMRIASGGNVGIGNINPQSTLDISSPATVLRLASTTGTNAVYQRITNDGGQLYFGIDNSAGNDLASGSTAHAAVLVAPGTTRNLHFGTNGTVRATITSAGNVGIGTNNPSYKVHAVKTGGGIVGRFDNADGVADIYGYGLEITRSDAYIKSSGVLHLGSSHGYSTIYIDTSGRVGIGTTDIATFGRKLLVSGTGGFNNDSGTVGIGFSRGAANTYGYIGTGDWAVNYLSAADFGISSGSAGALVFGTGAGTERMRIASGGNVGIGTNNPTAKLTVKGQTHTAPWLAVERSDSGTLQFRIVNAENTGYTASTGTVSAPWTNVIDSSNSDLMLSSLFGGGTGGRIILDGKVGIGKTNPGVALDVVGNAQITTTAAGTYGLIAVGSSGGARDIFLAGQSGFSNGFTVRYDGAAMVYAFQDGNVCIGATTPFGNLGVAGSTNLGNNVASSQAAQYFTRLSGYAARYDASNRYGSYGQLIFHADDGWTGGARRWMITNVLNVTSFGIIRSATALTDPGLGDGGSVNSGTVDFAISNTGRISMGATGVSNNQAKLEITGGSLVVNSKGGGNRFQELQMVSGHVQAGGSTVWTTFMYSGPTFVGNIRVIAVDNRGQSFGCASWVGVANICYGGGSGPLVTQTAALSGSISAVNVIYNNSGYILQAAVTYSGATSGVTIYFSFDGNGSDAMYAEA